MKIVIQCAGSKDKSAGSLRLHDGKKVIFVADPSATLSRSGIFYAKPDDLAEGESHESWRDKLLAYNKNDAVRNPQHLLPAYKLYTNPAYEHLVSRFGKNKVFILSAGWGLIPSHFLTPPYDITFSASGERFNRRKKHDKYNDFSMMQNDGEEIVFLGGKSYLPQFYDLTKGMRGRKVIFFNSSTFPTGLPPDIETKRFETSTRTNWHYECANALCEDKITV